MHELLRQFSPRAPSHGWHRISRRGRLRRDPHFHLLHPLALISFMELKRGPYLDFIPRTLELVFLGFGWMELTPLSFEDFKLL